MKHNTCNQENKDGVAVNFIHAYNHRYFSQAFSSTEAQWPGLQARNLKLHTDYNDEIINIMHGNLLNVF